MIELQVLRTIALKGRCAAAAVAESTGLPEGEVTSVIEGAVAAGHLKQLPAAVRVTPGGRAHVAGLLEQERAHVDVDAVAALYDDFTEVNAEAKEVFTNWQLRDGSPNDHLDAAYDEDVLDRLTGIHERVLPIVDRVSSVAPRLGRYRDRLAMAQERYAGGDHSWVTKPIIDSYHTVWFELHEELISLAGLTRADEAAAGRAQ